MEKFGGTERQRREREKVEEMRRVEKQKQRENNVRQRVEEIEKIRVESKTTEKTQKRIKQRSGDQEREKAEKDIEGAGEAISPFTIEFYNIRGQNRV